MLSLSKRLAGAAALALVASLSQAATTFTYTAVDLADPAPGQDLWRYDYLLTGSFGLFDGFNVYFDPLLYTALQDPPVAAEPGWSVFAVQPNANLQAAGIFSGLATVAAAPVQALFSIEFAWLGGPGQQPGAQPFERVDPDFIVLETGATQPTTPIPLPAAAWLLASAGAGLGLFGRRRKGAA